MCQECKTLFGVDVVHLDPRAKDQLFTHQNDRELAITETFVSAVAAALGLTFTPDETRTLVCSLVEDAERGFDGRRDHTVSALDPRHIVAVVGLYGQISTAG